MLGDIANTSLTAINSERSEQIDKHLQEKIWQNLYIKKYKFK